MQADATATGLPTGSFDVAYAQRLLIHSPEPKRMVDEVVRVLRPGGGLAILDVDMDCAGCDPPHPAWSRLFGVYQDVFFEEGLDRSIARRLPSLLRRAGLVDVHAEVHAQVDPPGSPGRAILPQLVRAIRPRILERGLHTEDELDTLLATLSAHLADPQTVVYSALLVGAWGHTPNLSSAR